MLQIYCGEPYVAVIQTILLAESVKKLVFGVVILLLIIVCTERFVTLSRTPLPKGLGKFVE